MLRHAQEQPAIRRERAEDEIVTTSVRPERVDGVPPPQPLRAAPAPRVIDLEAAERAAADLLRALGIGTDGEGLAGTPRRVARAYAELFTPTEFDMTTFANDEGYDELVLARDIPLRSVCEHHLLPFVGVAHVGYLPGQRIVGRSWPEWSTISPDAPRCRSGSPGRSPTVWARNSNRRASASSSKPSTRA
jgi:hypothetical protein